MKIVPFTGPTRLDIEAEKVLDEAKKTGLSSVVVVGYTVDGEVEYFASSTGDGAEVVWLLERAKLMVLNMADED